METTAPKHGEPAQTIEATPTEFPPALKPRYFQTRPQLRRVVFVAGYEALGVLFTVFLLNTILNHGGGESLSSAVIVTTVCAIWNYLWNLLFERLERIAGRGQRGAIARTLHAVGYELGALIFTIPLVAAILSVSLFEALMIEGGLLVFFLFFTVVYTWAFDRVFGLPASAAAEPNKR